MLLLNLPEHIKGFLYHPVMISQLNNYFKTQYHFFIPFFSKHKFWEEND